MMNIETLIPLFANYGILILILGGILGGEEVIISLVFLASLGTFPLWWVIVFVTIGELIADTLVFTIGRTGLFDRMIRHKKVGKLYDKADRLIMKISKESVFLTIMYSKFIYGIRIFTLLYLGSKKIKWQKYMYSETTVLLIWMTATVAIGWVAGVSVHKISQIFKNVETTLLSLIGLIVIVYFVKKWIYSKLLEKQKIKS